MHFWIDKRSQACGFGRARVAASLSGTGSGVGLGFAHPPRRIGGKTTMMVPPVHRLQSGECVRPHIHHSNSNNNGGGHHANTNPVNHSNNNHTHTANMAATPSGGNNSNNNRNSSSNRTHRSSHHASNNSSGNSNNNNNSHHHVITHHDIRNYHHHPQFGSALNGNSGRHHHSSSGSEGVYNTAHTHNNHVQRASHHMASVNSANSAECQVAVQLPHIYGGPSHAQDLEQGPLGIGPMSARPNLHGIGNSVTHGMIEGPDTQLLPAHLKCGMWASLVLASVFVAGAKFYFDHQGTGLEVLIFCAFSATFFLAACTVSLCRLPRDLATSPSPSVDDHTRGLLASNGVNQHPLYAQNGDQRLIELNQQHAAATAAPPPYHIAILLPENSKEILPPDETPPPSYDKILI